MLSTRRPTSKPLGTQFTCFTGTKVQILALTDAEHPQAYEQATYVLSLSIENTAGKAVAAAHLSAAGGSKAAVK
jgi:hypothetical protein